MGSKVLTRAPLANARIYEAAMNAEDLLQVVDGGIQVASD